MLVQGAWQWAFECKPFRNEDSKIELQMRGRQVFAKAIGACAGSHFVETSFESLCHDVEQDICGYEGLQCVCCERTGITPSCETCSHALGMHCCEESGDIVRWRPGTLFGGKLDVVSLLWGMSRRHVPLDVLKQKLQEYVKEGHLPEIEADEMCTVFEQMRGVWAETKALAGSNNTDAESSTASMEHTRPLTLDELRQELLNREALMQECRSTDPSVEGVHISDQWHVDQEAIAVLRDNKEALRLFVHASAGTGKSFLLVTLFLWCLCNEHDPVACAPTGIAAARIHIERTPVRAYTLHYLASMGTDLKSKVDPMQPQKEETMRMLKPTVFFLMRAECWMTTLGSL